MMVITSASSSPSPASSSSSPASSSSSSSSPSPASSSSSSSSCSSRESSADLDHVLDPAVCVSLNDGLDPDERLDVSVEPVGHELKLAVRWNERDRAVIVKPRQTNALMKLDVFKLNRLALTSASALKQDLQHIVTVSTQSAAQSLFLF